MAVFPPPVNRDMEDVAAMAPTSDTSSLARSLSTTSSVTFAVSESGVSFGKVIDMLNWVLSISGIKAVPLE